MNIAFDSEKNARNIQNRGLSFEDVVLLDWDNAIIINDTRKDYGEIRLRAFGYINDKPHVVVYTWRGETLWVISFRRAREKERKLYA